MKQSNFNITEELLFNKLNLSIKDVIYEKESKEYLPISFKVNEQKIYFRTAKITPKKQGQFVTLYKRSNLEIIPFDQNDKINYLMIFCEFNHQKGIFIFPKNILIKQNIISKNLKGGKRATRIYPNWDKPIVISAIEQQKWQSKFFFEIIDNKIDLNKIKVLFKEDKC